MRCLEDLRNWHTNETDYKVIEEEDDEMGQFFEEWPARIQAFEERMQQGKNAVNWFYKCNCEYILNGEMINHYRSER